MNPTTQRTVEIVATDRAVAVIAAVAAAGVDGVARLRPSLSGTVRSSLSRRLGSGTSRIAQVADPAAVTVERGEDPAAPVSVSVRLTIDGSRSARETVEDVQRGVNADLASIAAVSSTVAVHVAGLESRR